MYLNKLLILKKLQQANTHLGRIANAKNSRWARFSGQRTQSFIFGFRAGFAPIIDLDKTVICLRRACNVIQLIIRSNGHLLLINTNPKFNKIIQQTAKSTNQSFINHKWIGGFLTNWNHMQNVQQQFHAATTLAPASAGLLRSSAPRYKKMQKCFEGTKCPSGVLWEETPVSRTIPLSGQRSQTTSVRKVGVASYVAPTGGFQRRPKEPIGISPRGLALTTPGETNGRHSYPSFLRQPSQFVLPVDPLSKPAQRGAPDCVIIFNASQNSTAIYEAHLNQIPIIAIVDSSIPNELYQLITYPIPANYESVQFIYIFCNCILKTISVS